MTCLRCKSVMLACAPLRFEARSTDMSDSAQHLGAHRCPCCGNYEDRLVRRNRLAMAGAQ